MDASGDEGTKAAMDIGGAAADGAVGITAADGAIVQFNGDADSAAESAAVQDTVSSANAAGGAEASLVGILSDAPSAPRSTKPQRSFWGTYSAIVLGNQPPSRQCVSPTRGARELGKLLRDSSPVGLAGAETPSVLSEISLSALGSSSSSSTPYPADESGSDAPFACTDLVVAVADNLPEELSETAPEPDAEPFEVKRARERRARAKANAAKVVAQAREKQEAAAALELQEREKQDAAAAAREALEAAVETAPSPVVNGDHASSLAEDTQQRGPKRRRLLTKQKSSDTIPPPSVQNANGDPVSERPVGRQRPKWKKLPERPVMKEQRAQDVALPLQTQQSMDSEPSSQQVQEATPPAGMVVGSPQKLASSPCAPTELDESDDEMPQAIKRQSAEGALDALVSAPESSGEQVGVSCGGLVKRRRTSGDDTLMCVDIDP